MQSIAMTYIGMQAQPRPADILLHWSHFSRWSSPTTFTRLHSVSITYSMHEFRGKHVTREEAATRVVYFYYSKFFANEIEPARRATHYNTLCSWSLLVLAVDDGAGNMVWCSLCFGPRFASLSHASPHRPNNFPWQYPVREIYSWRRMSPGYHDFVILCYAERRTILCRAQYGREIPLCFSAGATTMRRQNIWSPPLLCVSSAHENHDMNKTFPLCPHAAPT